MPIWIPLAIAAAALQTGANIIGSRKQAKVAMRNTNLTIAENKKLSEEAYQREQSNVSAMLKYNEPSAQMKRFEDAGLNRNLIYTQGNPGNQTTIAKYNPPNVEYKYQSAFNASDLQPITSLPQAALQFKKLISENRIKEAEATVSEAVAKYAMIIEKTKANITNLQANKLRRENIIDMAAFDVFFENDPQGGYMLRPGKSEQFISSVISKYLTPVSQYENYQSTIAYRKQQLQLLESALPWLGDLVNFLKILK